ncbi:MAG TPA: glycosyltransferase family 39 protein, partial [Xanthomonadaceae bacterium]|nr:glycosyltransferase family 39 protein [Xanthomonadaceae bacterium]
RWFGAVAGWHAGSLLLLMPLTGTLGLLALPDVPMALATLLCLDAGARLLQRVDAGAALELAIGLAIGALSHYRFLAVIGIGLVAFLLLPQGRRVLRDPRVWIALAFGVAAWAPLLAWNLDNAEAGLRFQLQDRHPWRFHWSGGWFLLVQALLVTPLLFVALIQTFLHAWRTTDDDAQWRYFGLLGGVSTLGFFVLGFFADDERVSFHWPLPGYLALLAAVPIVLRSWPRGWRLATWWLAGIGLAGAFGYYLLAATPTLRARFAAEKFHPGNFAGWDAAAAAVRAQHARMPPGTRLVVDNFKLGAQLGFALDDPDIAVLPHAANRQHGRAAQLQLWGLEHARRETLGGAPLLLVVGASEVEFKHLLQRYREICASVGPLPPARVVQTDHGRQRFLLFALPAGPRAAGPCTLPAMAWLDAPVVGSSVERRFSVRGWAFRDGVGLRGVEITLDGKPVALARYGLPQPGLAFWWGGSTDPNHPRVGFAATVDADASRITPGRHWLGLRLQGSDGAIETWPEQPVTIR